MDPNFLKDNENCENLLKKINYKIIVCRYNECINWLYNDLSNCFIYNTGPKLNISNEINIENVGREANVYLKYIIDNYNNLPDIIVFTQAKISDHLTRHGFLQKNNIMFLYQLIFEANINKKSLHQAWYKKSNNLCCWSHDWNKYFCKSLKYKNDKFIIFSDWFEEHINKPYPHDIMYIYRNAIFAVKKELILKHSFEYYKKLINEVNYFSNPIESHFFERSWYYIFN
tara:strand:- start:3572 stop:4255 length:684 start_codon:yes stop_codon:yes gene_type:complete